MGWEGSRRQTIIDLSRRTAFEGEKNRDWWNRAVADYSNSFLLLSSLQRYYDTDSYEATKHTAKKAPLLTPLGPGYSIYVVRFNVGAPGRPLFCSSRHESLPSVVHQRRRFCCRRWGSHRVSPPIPWLDLLPTQSRTAQTNLAPSLATTSSSQGYTRCLPQSSGVSTHCSCLTRGWTSWKYLLPTPCLLEAWRYSRFQLEC